MGWKWKRAAGKHRAGEELPTAFEAISEIPRETRRAEPTVVVHPGKVTSRRDGDVHIVTFTRLCRLYGVDPRRALNAAHPAHAALARYRRDLGEDVIDLFPREDGGYDGAAIVLGLANGGNV